MIEAEIEMPDGTRVFYRNFQWVCPDQETKAVVEYFANLEQEIDHDPCPIATQIEEVVKRVVGAKLIRLDIPMDVENPNYID